MKKSWQEIARSREKVLRRTFGDLAHARDELEAARTREQLNAGRWALAQQQQQAPVEEPIDARTCDHASLVALMRSRGLSTEYLVDSHANEASRISPAVRTAIAADQATEAQRREVAIKELPAFDGRRASVADVRQRLQQLGVSPVGLDLLDPARPPSGAPLPEASLAAAAFAGDPSAMRQAQLSREAVAERTLAAKITTAAKAGRTVHASQLTDDEFKVWMRKRGFGDLAGPPPIR